MPFLSLLWGLALSYSAFSAPPEANCAADFKWDRNTSFYEDSPTYREKYDDTESWRFSHPTKEGMNEKLLRAGARRLADEGGEPYSFLVIKNNALVFEKYYNGANRFHSNNIHSASKSILGAAIGAAIQDGHITGIDQKVHQFLAPEFKGIDEKEKYQIRIKDLLNMRGGLSWWENISEFYIETRKNWVKAILEFSVDENPGKEFHYNTGLTHILSAALSRATKSNTCQYIHDRIFKPLGIKAEHWGRDPMGVYSGGYNVYLTPREMAKFGMLFANGGMWEGQQILPKAWTDQAMKRQVNAGDGYGYGYLWWTKRIKGHDVAIAWGHGGQFIYVVKSLNLVMVTTANTRDYLGTFSPDYLIEDYVIPAVIRKATMAKSFSKPPKSGKRQIAKSPVDLRKDLKAILRENKKLAEAKGKKKGA